MNQDTTYVPIDCGFYDRLEAWATLRENVRIKQLDQEALIEGVIKDLYIREKVEYLQLDTGKEVRLDTIESVNDIILTDSCSL